MKLDTIYTALLVVIVAAVVVVTFLFPFQSMRAKALDSTMSAALTETSQEVKNYFYDKSMLPDDLASLEFKSSYSSVNNNSGILKKITYTKVDDTTYKLCADFKTEQKGAIDMYSPMQLGGVAGDAKEIAASYYVDYQAHPKGYHCFNDEQVVDFGKYYLDDIKNNPYDFPYDSQDIEFPDDSQNQDTMYTL